MYENRSQSVQETQGENKGGGSPVMLRRKDSLKNKKNSEDALKEDRRSGQVKQMSLDHQGLKKNDVVAAPTPKRTSTVFGKLQSEREEMSNVKFDNKLRMVQHVCLESAFD